MLNRAAIAAILAAALALAAGGCAGSKQLNGGDAQAPTSQPPPAQSTVNSLPPFPSGREASGITETLILGKEAEQRSAGATEIGSALELPAGSAPNWAAYRFNAGAQPPDSVAVQLEPGQTDGVFIALADYALGKWEVHGPYSGAKTMLLDDEKYVSAAGNVWVAVVAPAGTQALVNALSIREVTGANQPPVAALTADVTSGPAPLTVNFDASGSSDSDGEIIEYAWDWDGNGGYEEFSDAPFITHTFSTAGTYSVRMRVRDDRLATSYAAVSIVVTLGGNQPPVASFTVTPPSGDGPLTVELDGSASSDPDGHIVEWNWDFTGDGVYEDYESGARVSHEYGPFGTFVIKLRVIDDEGASAIDSQPLIVDAAWNRYTVDNVDYPEYPAPSLANIAGCPAICYWDGSTAIVKYARCETPDGSGPWTVVTVAPGQGGWLTEVGGCPAILRYELDTYDLTYMRCDAADGTGIWQSAIVANDPEIHTPDMKLIGGYPAVTFTDSWGPALNYATVYDPAGIGAWQSYVVDDPPAAFLNRTSLAELNGRPAIAYHNVTDGLIDFATCDAADGSGTWNLRSLFQGSYPELEIVDGSAAILYTFGLELRYARSATSDGFDSWDSVLIAPMTAGPAMSSMAVVNGSPLVACMGWNIPPLLCGCCTVPNGLGPWNLAEIEPAGTGMWMPMIAPLGSSFGVAYYDSAQNTLQVAFPGT